MTGTNCVLDCSDKNCPILTEIDVVVVVSLLDGAVLVMSVVTVLSWAVSVR